MTTDGPNRIIRFEEVLSRTGLTRSTLYRKIASRTFPKQIAISARCRGWRESEVNDWLHNPMSYEQEESPPAS
jgi:prophage regulatory protein